MRLRYRIYLFEISSFILLLWFIFYLMVEFTNNSGRENLVGFFMILNSLFFCLSNLVFQIKYKEIYMNFDFCQKAKKEILITIIALIIPLIFDFLLTGDYKANMTLFLPYSITIYVLNLFFSIIRIFLYRKT
jgi:hypothetical protein